MRNPVKRKNSPGTIIFLAILSIIFLFPLVVTVSGSFMTEQSILMNYTSSITTFDLSDGFTERFRNIILIPKIGRAHV